MADGKIIIDTKIDGSGAEKGVKALGSKIGSTAKKSLKAFTGVIAATGTALGGLGAVGLKYNSDMEQYMASFETMLGSADKANKHIAELKEFAAKTPFEMADLAKASTTLQAFGVDVKEIMPNLKMLGDISLGSKEKFDGLALVFGQVKSQGKLMGQDLMQMINNGFNPLQVISEKTGKSMSQLKDEMAKGEITYEMVADAMKTATSEGGKFCGGMEKQSTTASGLISTLKDNVNSLLGEVCIPLSDTLKNNVLPAAMGYIDTLTKAFREKGITGLVGAVGEIGANIIANITSQLPSLVNLAVEVISSFIEGITANLPLIAVSGMELLTTLANSITELLPQMLDLGMKMIFHFGEGILLSLPELFGNLSTLVDSIVQTLMENLPKLIELGAKLILALAQGFAENFPQMVPKILELVTKIADSIIENLPLLIDAGIEIIMALVDGLIEALPFLIEELPRIINEFANAIYSNLPKIIEAGIKIIVTLGKALIDSIPMLIENLPEIIMAIFNAITLFDWASAGTSLIKSIGNGIKSMPKHLATLARNIANGVKSAIKNIFSGGLSWGKEMVQGIGRGIRGMFSFLSSAASGLAKDAVGAIKGGFSKVGEIGTNLVKGLWNGIKNVKDWILGKIKGFCSGITDGIKSFFGIHSPSRLMRDMIGKNLVRGIGIGFDIETPNLQKDIDSNLSSITAKMRATVDYETGKTSRAMTAGVNNTTSNTVTNNDNGVTQHININQPVKSPAETARALKKVGRDLVLGY